MLKVHSFIDLSEKFSYCFCCQTEDQGHFYYSRMWRVEVFNPNDIYLTAPPPVIGKIGNLCESCATVLREQTVMIPVYIPEVQIGLFIKTFISKKVQGKGEKNDRKAGVILSRL